MKTARSKSIVKLWMARFVITTFLAVFGFIAFVPACFAADDKAQVSSGDKIYIDVLANDSLGSEAIIVKISQKPEKGNVEIRDEGKALLYYAPEKFEGSVKFRYVAKSSATDSNATEAESSVDVNVSQNSREVAVSDVQYGQVGKILLFLLVLSIWNSFRINHLGSLGCQMRTLK